MFFFRIPNIPKSLISVISSNSNNSPALFSDLFIIQMRYLSKINGSIKYAELDTTERFDQTTEIFQLFLQEDKNLFRNSIVLFNSFSVFFFKQFTI